MNLLVTGGLGFVGLNVVRHLAETIPGASIIAADVLKPTPAIQRFLAPVASRVRPHHLDVRDRAAFGDLVETAGVTHLVHAAAITSDDRREAAEAPFIVDVNLLGGINALAVSWAAPQVERMLLFSSGGLYGVPEEGDVAPRLEDGTLHLNSLYGITKYSAELLAGRYAALSGKPMVSVRPAAVYGPMERPTGSRQHMSQPCQLREALREGRRVKVAGPDARRDWVYAQDVAAAVCALLLAPHWSYPSYNIGSGGASRFEEMVDAFVRHGLQAEWVDDPAEADITPRPSRSRAYMDVGRLTRDTGFQPIYAPAEGVAHYLQHD